MTVENNEQLTASSYDRLAKADLFEVGTAIAVHLLVFAMAEHIAIALVCAQNVRSAIIVATLTALFRSSRSTVVARNALCKVIGTKHGLCVL